MKKFRILTVAFLFVAVLFGTNVNAQTITEGVTIVELNQVPGEFEVKKLNLKPGKYQFKVTNQGVDHEVGFVIQAAKDAQASPMETAVENSFSQWTIADGKTTTSGVVELKAGEYVYSCPLNPTPKYKLVVK